MGNPATECPKCEQAAENGKNGFEGKGKGARGEGIWQGNGDDVQGDWQWNQPEEEKPTREAVNIIDQDGYDLVKRPRRCAQQIPEIFAVGVNTKMDTDYPHRGDQSRHLHF